MFSIHTNIPDEGSNWLILSHMPTTAPMYGQEDGIFRKIRHDPHAIFYDRRSMNGSLEPMELEEICTKGSWEILPEDGR